MNRRQTLGLLAASLAMAACSATPAAAPPPLAGAKIGGPFALVDQDGRPRSERDFAGKYRIMYFGYTYCPDVCPVDMARLVAGYRAFAQVDAARAARVVPVFVSVDPARDTPAVLKQFTAAFAPGVVGLTGSPDAIAAVTRAYGVSFQINEPPKGTTSYLVDHSRFAVLMGPDDAPIALLSHDAKPDVIARELAKWVA